MHKKWNLNKILKKFIFSDWPYLTKAGTKLGRIEALLRRWRRRGAAVELFYRLNNNMDKFSYKITEWRANPRRLVSEDVVCRTKGATKNETLG